MDLDVVAGSVATLKNNGYHVLEDAALRRTLRTKLIWARDSKWELQLRDVKQLLDGPLDEHYLRQWAKALDVPLLEEAWP